MRGRHVPQAYRRTTTQGPDGIEEYVAVHAVAPDEDRAAGRRNRRVRRAEAHARIVAESARQRGRDRQRHGQPQRPHRRLACGARDHEHSRRGKLLHEPRPEHPDAPESPYDKCRGERRREHQRGPPIDGGKPHDTRDRQGDKAMFDEQGGREERSAHHDPPHARRMAHQHEKSDGGNRMTKELGIVNAHVLCEKQHVGGEERRCRSGVVFSRAKRTADRHQQPGPRHERRERQPTSSDDRVAEMAAPGRHHVKRERGVVVEEEAWVDGIQAISMDQFHCMVGIPSFVVVQADV